MMRIMKKSKCPIPDPGAVPKCQNPYQGESWLSKVPLGRPPPRCIMSQVLFEATALIGGSHYRYISEQT